MTTLGRLGGYQAAEADRGEKALWLSGAGHRAALFHLGALTRLNELGMLGQLGTVGAVAGGSILAALLEARVPWPLLGTFRDWPERVAEPMREIAGRNERARALLRRPFRGGGAAGLEESYARELASALGGASEWGPRFVFGASGLTLSGLAAGWEDCLEWRIDAVVPAPGYDAELVAETIGAVRTDLDAFGEAERSVLENHGYLVADAALRERGLTVAGGIRTRSPEPPFPQWTSADKVRRALASSGRRTAVGRLRPRRVRGRAERRRGEPGSAELTALLDRHRPLLQYDSLESCRADSVETICSLAVGKRCNSLHRADGTPIASVAPSEGEARLELAFLGADYADGQPAREDDCLDECGGSHAADAVLARGRKGFADVVYGRARHDEQGCLWLQYWLFFYYADRGMLGLEHHEGDWQMVQLRLGGGGEPEEATFAQRDGAERLRWDQVVRASTGRGRAAVVYPARGSHAPRPRSGSFAAPVVGDHNDGLGPRLRPRLAAIGDDGPDWVLWPGRWGATRRRQHFEADSPRGPRRNPQWWDPAALHAEARPWQEGDGGEMAEPPPRPLVRVRREGSLAVVSYEFGVPGAGEGEPARIVAAPFDRTANPAGCQSLAVEGRSGSFALQLPPGRGWAGVRVGATSAAGAPGGTVAAAFGREGEERAG
ncbi:MAG: hypothetical protein R2725_03455 [Solirubrobacterales bacterium]